MGGCCEVGQAGSHGEDQVGFGGQLIAGRRTLQADPAQLPPVPLLHRTLASECFGDRDPRSCRKLGQLLRGSGVDNAPAGDDHGLFRSCQQGGDGVDLFRVWHRASDRPVAFVKHLGRPVVRVRLHILRQRQHYGTGVRRIREHPHRCRQRCQQRLRPADPIEEPGHRSKCIVHRHIRFDGVLQLLQDRALPAGRVGVSRQQQDRQPVHRRQRRPGHQVHRSGTDRGRHCQCRMPSRRLGVPGCHVHQRLLIAALNERQRVAELVQRLTQPGHVSVAEDPQRGRNQPATMPIGHRILPGDVCNQGLRNGQPHRASGRVAHESNSYLDCSARCARSARIAQCSRLLRRRSGTKSVSPHSSSARRRAIRFAYQARPCKITVLRSVISSTAQRGPSLPIPLPLSPPYGIRSARHSGVQLM